MDSERKTPLEWIKGGEHGECSWGMVRLTTDGPWEVAWLIRESDDVINSLNNKTVVTTAGGCFVFHDVVVMVVMFSITDPPTSDSVYASYFNYWDDPTSLPTLQMQEISTIGFVNDDGDISCSLTIVNGVRRAARLFLEEAAKYRRWSHREFCEAIGVIEERHTTDWDLWGKMCSHLRTS